MVLNEQTRGKSGKSFHKAKPRDGSANVKDKAPAAPPKAGLDARIAAAKILSAVVDRKTSLDGMLDAEHGNPAFLALGEADRGLVRAILQTALRYLPRIEAILGQLLDSPLPEGARSLHHLLVVGAVQMLYLDVPDHSAVDLAVEQANRDPRNRRFAKLTNAILRRLGREKAELLESVADVVCMPGWFFDRLVAAYGREAADAIARAQLQPAAIDITVKEDAAGWAAKLGGQVLPTGSVRLDPFRGAITTLEGFEDGAWWVQDAAAAVPACLMGDVRGRRVVDLCAAPGGKTAQLAAMGAEVTAVEQSESRLKRLKSNLARLGFSADCVRSNLLDFAGEQPFDAVLLDAPCSSTGTTRRHPDVLWTKGPEDIAKLAGVQEKLLRHALTLVGPGGRVVFSNCSLDPLEGEELIERVLTDNPAFSRVPIGPSDWPGMEAAISPKGDFRATPAVLADLGGMDGFYACVLAKI